MALHAEVARQPRKPDVAFCGTLESPGVDSSKKRYEGTVKYFRGSFGWIQCPEISAKYSGHDIFLHKQDCINKVGDSHEQPKQWDKITFQLSTDMNGNPKAIKARIQVDTTKNIGTIDPRDFFRQRKERSLIRARLP